MSSFTSKRPPAISTTNLTSSSTGTAPSTSIQSAGQLFQQIKQFMKMKEQKFILMKDLKNYLHNTTDIALSRIMAFINSKTRFDKSLPDEQCANIIRMLAAQYKGTDGKFLVDSNGIFYQSRYAKIKDKKTLLAEIQNAKDGLEVDEEILKFAGADVRDLIEQLIYQRQIIPIKSKLVQKGKVRGNNYQGYLLYSFPPQIKQLLPIILQQKMNKQDFQSQVKNLEQREQKLKQVYRTKTSVFRGDFDNICIQNVGRSQGKSGQNQSLESLQRIYGGWNPINKGSVPNFQQEVQEWFKNRK